MKHKWPNVPLGEVLRERQETPPADALASGEIRIVSKIGFNDGVIQFRADGETKTGMILIRPGDLVVSGINAGKGAIAIYDEQNTEPVAATIHYGAYIPNKDRVDVRFLWWLLRSGAFRELLLEYVPGGIKTELKAKRLLPIPVPLPDLPEQRRIVARIEQLAAQIEEARRLRHQATEEAEILPARATTHALDDAGWELKPLEELLAEPPRNGLGPQKQVETGGRVMLRINAVSSAPTRFVDLSANKMVDVPDSLAAPFVLQHDDVFIVRYNGDLNRVAKAAIFKGETDVIYPDKLIRLRPDANKMLPDFLVYALGSRSVRAQIEDLGKTTAGQIGVSGADAKSFRVPVPPPAEQRRIVGYLDGLAGQVAALARLQSETAAELDALLPSILDKAFKGAL
ncbi:MAG: restriction endonuclease subunit S [Verrucomicrobiia bacterium]